MEMKTFDIPVSLQQLITPEQAYTYRVVPFKEENSTAFFYTDVEDTNTLERKLDIILNRKTVFSLVSKEDLERLLRSNFRRQAGGKKTLHYSQDFLERVLLSAKEMGSSDIHFEPLEINCRVRFRIDGKLIEQYIIPENEFASILNRIKNKASLDISQKRLPQDGRITVETSGDAFDIRVSTLPTEHGESVVLRILSRDTSNIQLESLGFTDKELRIYNEGVKKPHGIVLLSGPTGSGKTTTLYATLKLLNNPDVKILTIEDPVEYRLGGIMQTQLREDINLTFESALKTFLRQDPDIIMVGEIRDAKTANMAIRASLTGHLVLSTIHTNSAWGTVSRLIDMGVPAHLIAGTLSLSVAQRLIRKLCIHCKNESKLKEDTFPLGYEVPKDLESHYEAVGCDHCYYTGYSGRKAIYELLPISKALSVHIKNNVLSVDDYLEKENIDQLKDHAFRLIRNGETSVNEVFSLLTN